MIDRVRVSATAFAFLYFVTSAQAFDINDLAKGVNILNQLTGGATQNTTNKPAEPSRPVTPEPPRPSSAAIREIQALLAQLGYDPGPADGVMGRRTAAAIRAFESDRGLAVTGAPDDRILASLREAAQYQAGSGTYAASSPPSFDCQYAATPTELAICGSDDLAELDRAVAANYAAALDARDGQGRAQLQAEQRNWMTERDRCGSDVMCLVYALGARSQALVVMANAENAIPQIPILPVPSSEAGTAASTTTAQATLPIFDFGEETKNKSAPIFLAYQGKTRVPFDWLPHDDVEQHRAALASIVFGQVSGTEKEEYFLKTRTLSTEEVFEALADSGIDLSPSLRSYFETDSARTVAHIPEAVRYSAADVNQFQEERLKSALRDKARASLSAQSGDSSLDVTVICAIEVLPYDFNTGMFPFAKDDLGHCFAGRPNAIGTVAGYQASIGISGSLRPEGFPIGATEAEALVERIGGPHFVLAVPAKITGRVEMQSSGQPLLAFSAEPTGAMEVRTGADLMEVLYRFPADGLRDVNDTPEARRLADFDRAWWINTPEEASAISERAETADLATLTSEDLFGDRTGLRLAVRLAYGKGVTAEDRTLSDFLDQRPDRETQEIAAALGLPAGNLHLASLSPSLNGGLDRIVLVLPKTAQSYAITESLPPYAPEGGDYPEAHLEIVITAEKRVRLSGGQDRLVMAGHADKLVVRRNSIRLGYDASPEIASIAFSPIEVQSFETVQLVWKSDLLLSAAQILGVNFGEILVSQLESEASGFARNDAFARREAAVSLESEARARAVGKNLHWMQARVGLSPYDFDRGGWLIQSLSPAFDAGAPEADRALRIELMASGEDRRVFLPMAQDQAKAFQSASQTFPALDALLAFRIVDVDTTYGTEIPTLVFEPIEMILFDAGQAGTVIDPASVKYRHTFAPPLQDPDAASSENAGSIAASGLPAGTFPVLGVALGADFDTSVEQLAQRIGVERRLYARTDTRQAVLERDTGGSIMHWEPYHNATLLESAGSSDMVAIYHEPPGDASTVTGIVRTKIFEPGRGPSWPVLRDNLLKSYPQIDAAELEMLDNPDHIVLWNAPKHRPGDPVDPMAGACQRRVNAATAMSVTTLYSFRRARNEGNLPVFDPYATWVDAEGADAIPSLSTPLSMPLLFASSADCPPHEVMALIMLYGDDGRVVEYRQSVTMPAQVAAIAEQRKSEAAEAATADFDL